MADNMSALMGKMKGGAPTGGMGAGKPKLGYGKKAEAAPMEEEAPETGQYAEQVAAVLAGPSAQQAVEELLSNLTEEEVQAWADEYGQPVEEEAPMTEETGMTEE